MDDELDDDVIYIGDMNTYGFYGCSMMIYWRYEWGSILLVHMKHTPETMVDVE